ncbi:hypothetical protein [Polymorphospora sp. NPDC051019]|uniref:hypothetical protein n=1 Tax=unclassified Polymorphospora TaxID=2685497 RepID=UPI0034386E00
MTKDDDPTDDLHVPASARMADRSTDLPVDRLDFGDLAELAEYDDPPADEPLALVDAPRQMAPEPTSRRQKQRNQRR